MSDLVLQTVGTRTCSGCKRVLPISVFARHPRCKGGRIWQCRECVNAAARRKYSTGSYTITPFVEKETDLGTERQCRGCGDFWPLDMFPKAKNCRGGRLWFCKSCRTDRRALAERDHNPEPQERR